MNRESPVLLKQVRILDPVASSDRVADILIAEGRVAAIAPHLEIPPSETAVIDAQGAVLAPGLADLYSHSGEPGYEARETLNSLAAAAAAGGFTRLAVLPDTTPAIDNPALVQALRSQAGAGAAPLDFWGAITLGRAAGQMAELAELSASGIVGFTDDCPLENLGLLRRVLEYLQPLGKPVALVPTNTALRGNGVMREGIASIRYGLPGNPAVSEAAALAAILEVIAATETPVHLMRIATSRGVELIAEAKARGVPVTASTTWLHLLLNAQDVGSYDPNLRLEPPLGNEKDRGALSAGVKQGIIDGIAIDHAPYTYEEKAVGFAEAPPGAIGLELALPLLWQRFVASGEWTALQLWQALSVNPRLCLQQQPVSCAIGQRAELLLFNPSQTWTVGEGSLKSLATNTPWWGKELAGRVLRTWIPPLI